MTTAMRDSKQSNLFCKLNVERKAMRSILQLSSHEHQCENNGNDGK